MPRPRRILLAPSAVATDEIQNGRPTVGRESQNSSLVACGSDVERRNNRAVVDISGQDTFLPYRRALQLTVRAKRRLVCKGRQDYRGEDAGNSVRPVAMHHHDFGAPACKHTANEPCAVIWISALAVAAPQFARLAHIAQSFATFRFLRRVIDTSVW